MMALDFILAMDAETIQLSSLIQESLAET